MLPAFSNLSLSLSILFILYDTKKKQQNKSWGYSYITAGHNTVYFIPLEAVVAVGVR